MLDRMAREHVADRIAVISDPEDPKFDLEAFLKAKAAES